MERPAGAWAHMTMCPSTGRFVVAIVHVRCSQMKHTTAAATATACNATASAAARAAAGSTAGATAPLRPSGSLERLDSRWPQHVGYCGEQRISHVDVFLPQHPALT